MPKCKVCGSRISDGTTQCPMCGAKIAAAQGTARSPVQPTPQAKSAQPAASAQPVQPSSPAPQPSYQPQPSSKNPAEISSAVAYLVAQNSKIRMSADRIMDTYRLQYESSTNKKSNGTTGQMAAEVRLVAQMAASWESVIYDIENTRNYIGSPQCADGTYQSAVNDFYQSVQVAEQGIRRMRKECFGAKLAFPLMLVAIIVLPIAFLSVIPIPLVAGLVFLALIGPTIMSGFLAFQGAKQKKRLDSFLQRISL